MGASDLANVMIICSENEVHVFALGQSTVTDSDQPSSWGFSLADL